MFTLLDDNIMDNVLTYFAVILWAIINCYEFIILFYLSILNEIELL